METDIALRPLSLTWRDAAGGSWVLAFEGTTARWIPDVGSSMPSRPYVGNAEEGPQ